MNIARMTKMSIQYRPEPTPPKTISPSWMSNICTNPPRGMKESCIELTAPVDVTVVTTEKKADCTGPNLTSFPSMFPPGWSAVEDWSIPSGVKVGLPLTSDQIQSPTTVSYTHLRAHETDSYLVC